MAEIGARFRRFAERECRGASPLYERLAAGIADDPHLMALASEARPGQPVPNLFLAAIHYLLLRGVPHRLAAFYPSVAGPSTPEEDPCPAFRAFCIEHAEAIRSLIGSRLVQTNEVQRCACLLPGFAIAAREAHGRPLSIVEIGASAGLNLLWDRYGYTYGDGQRAGASDSPVQLACDVRGDRRPPIPRSMPAVASRVGIDLDPIDVADPDAALWLRALVWPDQPRRADTLRQAIALAVRERPRLLRGDALDLMPDAIAEAPPETLVCIVHTHTINQFSDTQRDRLASTLFAAAARRELVVVSIEWLGTAHPRLSRVSLADGIRTDDALADCDAHGEWLEWRA